MSIGLDEGPGEQECPQRTSSRRNIRSRLNCVRRGQLSGLILIVEQYPECRARVRAGEKGRERVGRTYNGSVLYATTEITDASGGVTVLAMK